MAMLSRLNCCNLSVHRVEVLGAVFLSCPPHTGSAQHRTSIKFISSMYSPVILMLVAHVFSTFFETWWRRNDVLPRGRLFRVDI